MSVALIADTHFSNSYGYGGISDSSIINYRFSKQLEAFEKVLSYCKEHQIKEMIHLGDVFNSCNPTSIELYKFGQLFEKVYTVFDKVLWLVGNHDISSGGVSSLIWLRSFVSVDCLIDTMKEEGNFVFIPWFGYRQEKERGKQIEVFLGGIRDKQKKIVLGHFPVTGSKVGINDFELMKDSDFVEVESLLEFKAVYLGHIHLRQKLDNLEYVGSLLPLDFGEANEEKGFVVIDM